jgi:hypothetical protein
MTTKNRPVRKKPKSYTPIVFKINKELHEGIKQPPRTSLRRFREGIADATDWFNISFRIRVGIYLARAEYQQETVEDMTDAFMLCDTIYTRAKQDNGPDWTITPEEIDYIESALDAVDIMQDETTRRAQLYAHQVSQKIMHVYVKSFDDYIAKVTSCTQESSI